MKPSNRARCSACVLSCAAIVALAGCSGLPPPALAAKPEMPLVLELKHVAGILYGIELEVEGRPITALLDTGCKDYLALPPSLVRAFGLKTP